MGYCQVKRVVARREGKKRVKDSSARDKADGQSRAAARPPPEQQTKKAREDGSQRNEGKRVLAADGGRRAGKVAGRQGNKTRQSHLNAGRS